MGGPDAERFNKICEKVLASEHEKAGIGTLNEKALHSILKLYLEPDETRHETKIGRFVADIFRDNEIIEIQTRNFYGMKKKLAFFLERYPVTIVYPMANEKYINWIDPDTGEIKNRRRSPKKPHPQEMAHELIHILPFIEDPNLSFHIIFINVEDYRLLNGWDRSKKKGSERYERIPTAIVSEKYIRSASDYSWFIPDGLPAEFTKKEYKKSAGITDTCAQRMLYILMKLDLVRRVGKRGRAWIYARSVS